MSSSWKYIESAPSNTKKMFVVCAFDVILDSGSKYTSDPVTTWAENGKFPRWKHDFEPTHWVELPEFYR